MLRSAITGGYFGDRGGSVGRAFFWLEISSMEESSSSAPLAVMPMRIPFSCDATSMSCAPMPGRSAFQRLWRDRPTETAYLQLRRRDVPPFVCINGIFNGGRIPRAPPFDQNCLLSGGGDGRACASPAHASPAFPISNSARFFCPAARSRQQRFLLQSGAANEVPPGWEARRVAHRTGTGPLCIIGHMP